MFGRTENSVEIIDGQLLHNGNSLYWEVSWYFTNLLLFYKVSNSRVKLQCCLFQDVRKQKDTKLSDCQNVINRNNSGQRDTYFALSKTHDGDNHILHFFLILDFIHFLLLFNLAYKKSLRNSLPSQAKPPCTQINRINQGHFILKNKKITTLQSYHDL